jgi:hypothetical protein
MGDKGKRRITEEWTKGNEAVANTFRATAYNKKKG